MRTHEDAPASELRVTFRDHESEYFEDIALVKDGGAVLDIPDHKTALKIEN